MKYKRIKIATALVVVGLIGGVIYNQVTAKKSYDYSDYYVETKTTKKESNKENEEASEKELSLSLLKKTNNDYYVSKNINKEYANAGIPFVSADGNIDSKNVVIYGHSSKWDNIIFTPLMSYIDQNYYKKHDTFKFITEDETRIYQIFGVMNIDLNDLNDSLEFTQTEWDSTNSFNAFISDSINRGLYKTGVSVNKEDRLMTLVTCDTRDNNKRIVILAKLVNIANV